MGQRQEELPAQVEGKAAFSSLGPDLHGVATQDDMEDPQGRLSRVGDIHELPQHGLPGIDLMDTAREPS
jgi:hypothetical protein